MFFGRYLRKKSAIPFAVIDSQFPQKEPLGFRNSEINEYLRRIDGSFALTMQPTIPGPAAWFRHSYGPDQLTFQENLRGYLRHYPENEGRIEQISSGRRYSVQLAYTFFLAETYTLLPFLEHQRIPFAFVLYPGGGFGLDNPASDAMLEKIFSSQFFRGVIVTQPKTEQYLIRKRLCSKEKIHFIYGGFVQFKQKDVLPRQYYGDDKEWLDIAFVGAKYSEKGVDKGYDLFIETAKKLSMTLPNARFHVVGGFSANDIDCASLGDKIQFYGYQQPSFLRQFYQKVDILLSPNRNGALFPGNFDGFPIGIDASYCGAALFVSDPLNMNQYYRNKEDVVIIPVNSTEIAKIITTYYNSPEELRRLAKRGQVKTQEIFDIDTQINKRLNVFRTLTNLEISEK